MTKKEYKIISEALEKCKERIERSFDYFIDDIKNLEPQNENTAK